MRRHEAYEKPSARRVRERRETIRRARRLALKQAQREGLACHSTDEIAEACNVGKATVSEVCSESAVLPKANEAAASHATDFDPPIYNVWKQEGLHG